MKFRTTKTVGRVLILAPFFACAALAAAATLVNINTADSATLQTLNGIGPSKAQAIIDYRTQNGPFAKIEDIQNVSGIGPSTYASIKDYITVDGGAASQTQTTQTQSTTSQSQTSSATPQGNGTSAPEISAKILTGAQALVGAGTAFDGAAYGSTGEPLVSNVRYVWNFGDGTAAEGKHVLHTYRYPGTYSVELSIAYHFSSASVRIKLPVVVPQILLVAEGDSSLTIYNQSASDLDIGFWTLVDGASKPFVIPEDTLVLAGEGVRFGASVTGLPGTPGALLLYPNGTQAASAQVSKSSPLRGERVVAAPLVTVAKAAPVPTDIATNTQLAAVATAPAPASNMPWLPLGGLALLLTAGGAGAWYTGRISPKGTSAAPEEFDIE